MANYEHVALLKKDVKAWNAWRDENADIRPDLAEAILDDANLYNANLYRADLTQANLFNAYLYMANLSGAKLNWARLVRANLSGANLTGAKLSGADLTEADLQQAKLSGANLRGANLSAARLTRANLRWANLQGANLQFSTLVETDLTRADLTNSRIYGVSAWRLKLEGSNQQNLHITPDAEAAITVDNIEVAQFIYLLLNNQKVRDVIDTITSKVVLILGRFTPERKQVLDDLRNELRKSNYLPVMFDFEKPTSRTTVETITLLARMARFVIADVSDAKSILQELQSIVPVLPSIPVQPLIVISQEEPGMFDYFHSYHWFLEPYRYKSQKHLLANLKKSVINPAEAKVWRLRGQ
jgi:hypothetical protein